MSTACRDRLQHDGQPSQRSCVRNCRVRDVEILKGKRREQRTGGRSGSCGAGRSEGGKRIQKQVQGVGTAGIRVAAGGERAEGVGGGEATAARTKGESGGRGLCRHHARAVYSVLCESQGSVM